MCGRDQPPYATLSSGASFGLARTQVRAAVSWAKLSEPKYKPRFFSFLLFFFLLLLSPALGRQCRRRASGLHAHTAPCVAGWRAGSRGMGRPEPEIRALSAGSPRRPEIGRPAAWWRHGSRGARVPAGPFKAASEPATWAHTLSSAAAWVCD